MDNYGIELNGIIGNMNKNGFSPILITLAVGFIIVVAASALGYFGPMFGPGAGLMRVCPEAWFDNRMPSPIGEDNLPREYFVVNGARVEVSEMDVEWVRANCEINAPTPVY